MLSVALSGEGGQQPAGDYRRVTWEIRWGAASVQGLDSISCVDVVGQMPGYMETGSHLGTIGASLCLPSREEGTMTA